jgi:PAS domain S-box-containing protein
MMNDSYRKLMSKPGHILVVGIVLMVLSWVLNAAFDTIGFHEKSVIREIFAPSYHDVWERLLTVFLIAAFIVYVNYITQGRDHLAEELHEAMLKALEEKARAEGILSAIGDGVSIQDTDFRILYQNEVHKNLVGGDFVGQYCYAAYNCRDQVCPDCPMATCFRDKVVHKVQKPAAPTLNATYIEVTASPLHDANGRLIAGIEVLRDISENKMAEEQLRHSEMRFRNLVESTSDWVWEIDANGVYTYASPRLRLLLGYEPDEVIGKTPFDFMPPEEAERVAALFSSLSSEMKAIYSLENTNLHKDGRQVVLETNAVPVLDGRGIFRGYRGIDRDITERKQAENNIRKLNEKLAQRAAQLSVTNKELEAFSSSVSHDLRAPLTRIYGSGQLIRELCRTNPGEEVQFLAQTICEGCEQMEELIEALLSLARVASGELHRSHCDMSGIAGLVAAELQLSEPYRQLQFHIEEGLTTDADERLVKVLMENLLGNAWKYTQKTSEALIEFGVTEAEGRTVYFVRDNGAGFAMENAHRLFKPFQRLHDSADFKGTGIGLATVQRIVDRHGGRVWCRGEVGRGATFYFTLDER